MIAHRRLKVCVICLSSKEANIVRRQLRYSDEMHAKVNLDVKSIDSLQQEWFDVTIISTNVKDRVELDFVKDNCINAALTCARYGPCIYANYESFLLTPNNMLTPTLFFFF
jgi:hypothetical protein